MYSSIQWLNYVATSNLSCRQFKSVVEKNVHGVLKEGLCEESLLPGLFETGEAEPCDKVKAWFDWASAKPNRQLICLSDSDYPPLLSELADPPRLLFCEGRLDLLAAPQLGMVGTRHPTMSGREDAYLFARALSAEGLVITSGLAAGIDAAAHEGALDIQGGTVAVLGCGIDRIYPRQHERLFEQIRSGGLIVSEYPPGTPPRAHQFPVRNRIVSGLSKGVLVVEASLDSGSLITARHALEQNRDVFAIPGSIHNPAAKGCHRLLKDGAMLVETVEDVLEGLGHDCQKLQTMRSPHTSLPLPTPPLDRLLSCVDRHGSTLESVLSRSDLPVSGVVSGLMSLCFSGHLRESDGRYHRVD